MKTDQSSIGWRFGATSAFAMNVSLGRELRALALSLGIWLFPQDAHSQSELAIGSPAITAGVFWSDPSIPNENVPASYQTWGQVITIPTGETLISSATVFEENPNADGDATYFGLSLFRWSSALDEPIGLAIYQSAPVSLSVDNLNPPDPTAEDLRPTTFEIGDSVVPGAEYILELLGDGAAGVAMGQGYADGGLYLKQGGSEWAEFGDYDWRTNIEFDKTPVPETSDSAAMLAIGALGIAAIRWKRTTA
jgi:hypothetical protein